MKMFHIKGFIVTYPNKIQTLIKIEIIIMHTNQWILSILSEVKKFKILYSIFRNLNQYTGLKHLI
jgi:hypothetical protein